MKRTKQLCTVLFMAAVGLVGCTTAAAPEQATDEIAYDGECIDDCIDDWSDCIEYCLDKFAPNTEDVNNCQMGCDDIRYNCEGDCAGGTNACNDSSDCNGSEGCCDGHCSPYCS